MAKELCNSEMIPLINWYGWKRCFEVYDKKKGGFGRALCVKDKGHEGSCRGNYCIILEWDNNASNNRDKQ